MVEGAYHTPQYRARVWDGKQHFLKRHVDGYVLPVGLFPDVYDMVKHMDVVDERRVPGATVSYGWHGPELRNYQIETVARALKDRGLMTGKGMLNLPIRSGKTLVAAAIIAQTGLRTLFVVESKLLLHQTAHGTDGEGGFADVLGADIGLVGDGHKDIRHVTVATVQTLLKRKKLALRLLRKADLLIVDECHHMKAPQWGRLLMAGDGYYKLGLSATIFMRKSKPNEKSAIWFRACTGPVLTRVSPSRLIKEGYLFAPCIQIHTIKEPVLGRMKYQQAYKQGIERNEHRNGKIVELAAEAMDKGLRVLVDTGRLKQVSLILDALQARGYAAERIIGKTPSDERMEILRKFRANKIGCVVGTVMGEGVDIPELEMVINAEGQRSRTATIQRMRNLTACAEKHEVIFIDFYDDTCAVLKKHSRERLKTYQGFRHFQVEMMDREN
jgi:superfamily II DNA or RNA helicase